MNEYEMQIENNRRRYCSIQRSSNVWLGGDDLSKYSKVGREKTFYGRKEATPKVANEPEAKLKDGRGMMGGGCKSVSIDLLAYG